MMQLKTTFVQIGCVLGATLLCSIMFTVVSSVQILAGNTRFVMRAATVYVGFMSLLLLVLGGMAFYHGTHLEASSLGSHAGYFHSKFNGLTTQCMVMAGLVVLGWLLLYKPYERRLLQTQQNRANLISSSM